MHAIGKVLIDVIVVLFFVGMAGSAIVVVISFFEDFKELFGDDDAVPEPTPHAPAKTAEASRGIGYPASKPHVQL